MKSKNKSLLIVTLTVLAGISCTVWLISPGRTTQSGGRKVLFYQDSMHPWVKSDRPGKCTLCAMDLTPIAEGEKSFDTDGNTIALSGNSITVLHVQAEEVKRQPLSLTLRVAGTLEADEARKTIVSAPVACRIQSLAVPYTGVEVEEGQPLLTLYSPDLVLKRSYLRSLGSTYAGPTNHLVPSGMKTDPFSSDLLAPQSGTIIERNVSNGQYVPEGEKLMTIVDSSVLWFRFDVYGRQLPWFKPGQTLEVAVEGVPETTFQAVISFIEPALNDATRTVKVRAELKNPIVSTEDHPQRLLRLGLYAEGRVQAEIASVLAVPRSAILSPGGTTYAYVDKGDGAYERRVVKLGRQGDDTWEVLQGLEAGDRVVTSGNVLIDSQAQFNHGNKPDSAGTDEMPATGSKEKAPAVGAVLNPAAQKALDEFKEVSPVIAPVSRLVAPANMDLAATTPDAPRVKEPRAPKEKPTQAAPSCPAPMANMGTHSTSPAPAMRVPDAEAAKPSAGEIQGRVDLRFGPVAAQREVSRMWRTSLAEAAASDQKAAELTPFTAPQRQAIEAFLAEVDGVSRALAADDLKQYNQIVARFAKVLPAMESELAASQRWGPAIVRVLALGQGSPPETLADARSRFLPYSVAMVDLAKQLRKQDPVFAGLKLYHCPMAPKPGLWLQAKGPLANPFYGAKMLTCGEEVKQ